MSDYTCRNCGDHRGTDWGTCPGCTPPAVLAATQALKDATRDAARRFDRDHADFRRAAIDLATLPERLALSATIRAHKPERAR